MNDNKSNKKELIRNILLVLVIFPAVWLVIDIEKHRPVHLSAERLGAFAAIIIVVIVDWLRKLNREKTD